MTKALQNLIDIKQADALAPLTRLPLTPSFALFPSIPTHPFYVHQGNSGMTKALQNLIDIKQADALALLHSLAPPRGHPLSLPSTPSPLRPILFPFKQGNSDMTKALQNLIDIKQADALAPLDRERILSAVGSMEGGYEELNDRVRSCITGARACSSFPEVQAAACGDDVLDCECHPPTPSPRPLAKPSHGESHAAAQRLPPPLLPSPCITGSSFPEIQAAACGDDVLDCELARTCLSRISVFCGAFIYGSQRSARPLLLFPLPAFAAQGRIPAFCMRRQCSRL
jgi:hypothetical protein